MKLKIRSRVKGRVYALALFIIPVILCFAVFPYEKACSFLTGKTLATSPDNLQLLRHIFISLSAPLTFMSIIAINRILKGQGFYYGFIGGIIAIMGSIFLVMDQGSFWLARALLYSLGEPNTELALHLDKTIEAARENLFFWPIFLLPIGVIIQSFGLVREKHIKPYQNLLMILSVLLIVILPLPSLKWISPVILGIALLPLAFKVLHHSESLLHEV
ncbi:MAG: hypothetical protein JXR70_16665 [Spirochaetales bacterium]|nr:hypothetical protein [Spirochaetales bacterium]